MLIRSCSSKKIYGDNFEVVSLSATSWLSFFKARNNLLNSISKKGCDVVISFLFKCDLLLSVASKDLLKVSSFRNMYMDEFRISYGPLMGFIYSSIHTLALKRFSAVVSMSEDMKNFLQFQGVKEDKLFLIPNFLDNTRVYFFFHLMKLMTINLYFNLFEMVGNVLFT